jgi:hypothetical protein
VNIVTPTVMGVLSSVALVAGAAREVGADEGVGFAAGVGIVVASGGSSAKAGALHRSRTGSNAAHRGIIASRGHKERAAAFTARPSPFFARL